TRASSKRVQISPTRVTHASSHIRSRPSANAATTAKQALRQTRRRQPADEHGDQVAVLASGALLVDEEAPFSFDPWRQDVVDGAGHDDEVLGLVERPVDLAAVVGDTALGQRLSAEER